MVTAATEQAGPQLHGARWVVPVVGEPLADGAVVVSDGDIVAVGRRRQLERAYPTVQVHRWEGVLLPGLVNAHTHLQYTSFEPVGASHYPGYHAWSDAFVAEYQRHRAADFRASAARGAELAVRTGTTCIADVVTDVGARDALHDAGLAGVAYIEVLGHDEQSWCDQGRADLEAAVQSAPTSERARLGISPHTPYSVDTSVLAQTATFARERGLRMHIHLAEVDAEQEFYLTGSGWLAERIGRIVGPSWHLLANRGVGVTAAAYADTCGLLGDDVHVAHGVYLTDEDRRLLRERSTAVALCPRSNRIVGVDAPPVARLLADGVRIAVGTDSLASSPSLDLLADVAELARLAREQGYDSDDLDRRLVDAVTLAGARALGLDHLVGSLEEGKRADLAIFDVEGDDAYAAIVERGEGSCRATIVAGELRFSREDPRSRPRGARESCPDGQPGSRRTPA